MEFVHCLLAKKHNNIMLFSVYYRLNGLWSVCYVTESKLWSSPYCMSPRGNGFINTHRLHQTIIALQFILHNSQYLNRSCQIVLLYEEFIGLPGPLIVHPKNLNCVCHVTDIYILLLLYCNIMMTVDIL